MTPTEEAYHQEVVPLVLALKEQAKRLGLPCLIAIQVDQQIRITGDTTNARPAFADACMLLFREEE